MPENPAADPTSTSSTAVEAQTNDRSRRRRRGLVIILASTLALVLATGGVGFGVWVTHHDALTFGSLSNFPGDSADPVFGERTNIVSQFQEGRSYEYLFSIRNQDKVSVTITDLPERYDPLERFRNRQVRLGPRHQLGHARQSELSPFQPFDLEPDEERQVYIRSTFANCDTLGQGIGIDGQEVRFKILGIERSQWLQFEQPLAFWNQGPSTPACPFLQWDDGTITPRNPPAADARLSENSLNFMTGGRSYRLTLSSYRYGLLSRCHPSTGVPESDGVPVGLSIESVGEQPPIGMVLRLTARDTGGKATPLYFNIPAVRIQQSCVASTELRVEVGNIQPLMLSGMATLAPFSPPAVTVDIALQEDGAYRTVGSLPLTFPPGPETSDRRRLKG